eukprot:TRINITY_DN1557_c0_g1_i5.p1 TRINITY_DN1557_c0_g1~~TRINITY_DN1557_c0_g1_i5.p1  ORF type:complete len:1348 (+),score=286.60 TRINITY_DN1557_c0_g1_i5:161-4204(+)
MAMSVNNVWCLIVACLVGSVGASVNCGSYICPDGYNQNASNGTCPDTWLGQCMGNSTANTNACCSENYCTVPDQVSCKPSCSTVQECDGHCVCAGSYVGFPDLTCDFPGDDFTHQCQQTCANHQCTEGVIRDNRSAITCSNDVCTDQECCISCTRPFMPLYNETLTKSPAIKNRCVYCHNESCPVGWTKIDSWYNVNGTGWYTASFTPRSWNGWDSSFSCCYEELCQVNQDVQDQLNCNNGVCPNDLLTCANCYSCNVGYAGSGAVTCPSYGSDYATDCLSCSNVTCAPSTFRNEDVCNVHYCNTTECCIPSCSSYTCPSTFTNNASAGCADFANDKCTSAVPQNDDSCCYKGVNCTTYTCSAGMHQNVSAMGTTCSVIKNGVCTPGANDGVCCLENTCNATTDDIKIVNCTNDITTCTSVSNCGTCTCRDPGYAGTLKMLCPSDGLLWDMSGCEVTCAGGYDCLSMGYANKTGPGTTPIVCGNNCSMATCCECPSPQVGSPPNCDCPSPLHSVPAPTYCSMPSCANYTCPTSYWNRGDAATCVYAVATGNCGPRGDPSNDAACCVANTCTVTQTVFESTTCAPTSGGYKWYVQGTCKGIADAATCDGRPDCYYDTGTCKGCDTASMQTCSTPKCKWDANSTTCVPVERSCRTVEECQAATCSCDAKYTNVGGGDILVCAADGEPFTSPCHATCATYDCYPRINPNPGMQCGPVASDCNISTCCTGFVDKCETYTCPDGWVANTSSSQSYCKEASTTGACVEGTPNNLLCCVENICQPLGSDPEGMVCKNDTKTCRNGQECQCTCAGTWVGNASVICPTPGGALDVSGCDQACKNFQCTLPRNKVFDESKICNHTCNDEECCVPDCPPNSSPPDCDCDAPYHPSKANISWLQFSGDPAEWCVLPSCNTYVCPSLHKLKEAVGACAVADNVTSCKPNDQKNTDVCCDVYYGLYEPGSPGVHLSREIAEFSLEVLKGEVVEDLGLQCGGKAVGAKVDWKNSPPGKIVFSLEIPNECKPSVVQTRCVGVLNGDPNITLAEVSDSLSTSQNRITNFVNLPSSTEFTYIDRSGATQEEDLCLQISLHLPAASTHIPAPPAYYEISFAATGKVEVEGVAATLGISTDQIEYFEATAMQKGDSCAYFVSFVVEIYVPVDAVTQKLEQAPYACSIQAPSKRGARKSFKGRIIGYTGSLTHDQLSVALNITSAQVRLEKNLEFSFETREDPPPSVGALREGVLNSLPDGSVVIVEDLEPSEATLKELCRMKFTGMDCPPLFKPVVTNTCQLPKGAESPESNAKYYYAIAGLISLIIVTLIIYKIVSIPAKPPSREHSLSLLSTEMTEMNETIDVVT